jgi:hypothetical protein
MQTRIITILMACAALGGAQDPGAEPRGDRFRAAGAAGPGATIQFLSAEFSGEGKTVTGAPYSAEATTETVQMLADGNRITRRTSSRVARDSQGRTRREETVPAPRFEGTQDAKLTLIFINDPVAGVHYVVDPQRKEVRKMARLISFQGGGGEPAEAAAATPGRRVIVAQRHVRIERDGPGGTGAGTFAIPAPAPGGDFLLLLGDAGIVERKSEPLGSRQIEGVRCEGTRITETIPAGAIGNERPIVAVSERWYSPELQTTVLSRRTDPRFGETTYKLENLIRAEPPASLFEPPPGYQVIDAGAERIRIEDRFDPQ